MERRPLRVLVVDDFQDQADSLALLLDLWGYDACVAYDGARALEMASTRPPAVALLDLGLPGKVDGYELARQLRARTETAVTYLVAVTGYGRVCDRQQAKEAGFDDFLLKPYDPKEIEVVLKRCSASEDGVC